MAWEADYVTRDQFKNYVRIPLDDNRDDTQIGSVITTSSRAVDRAVSIRPNGMGAFRQFGLVDAPESRYYTARWDSKLFRWVVEIDDLMITAGMTVQFDNDRDDVFETFTADYILRPRDAALRNRPYTQIAIGVTGAQPTLFQDAVKVFAQWGWSSIPVTVQTATLVQAHRWFKRREAPLGGAGSSAKGTATEVVTDLDADVETMLVTYRKLRFTA